MIAAINPAAGVAINTAVPSTVVFPRLALLGHVTSGFANLGVSMWFVFYGLAAVLGLTILAVRVQVVPAGTAAAVRPEGSEDHAWSPFATRTASVGAAIGQVIGVALFVAVLVAALAGDPAGGSNPAPLVVFVAFFMGMGVVSMVVGDVWSVVSPFSTIAGLIERVRRSGPPDESERPKAVHVAGSDAAQNRDWWLPAALLFSFEAWWLVVVDGTRPRGVAVWLLGYSAVMLVGGVFGGRRWCRRNDPFAVLFAAFAELAPVEFDGGRPRWRTPLRRLSVIPGAPRRAAVLAVLVGSIAFYHAASTNCWLSKVNQQSEVTFTAVNLVGLAWCVGLTAIAWTAACRLAVGPNRDKGADELSIDLCPALVPLIGGLFLGYALPRLLIDTQNVVALSSDPFGRGWDLFGTLSLGLNEQPISAGVAGWLRVGFFAAGAMASIAVLHRRVLLHAPQPARPAAAPLLGFVVFATLGGTRLVLGT